MPRINTYSDNTSIENDDKVLTYDTQAAATKITAFSTIWNWIVSKLHALTSSSAALTPSTDRVLMDKNGTMTRVEPAAVAKYGIETYNGSTIAGSAQTVKAALDALNSKTDLTITRTENNYADETSIGRLWAYKRGNMLFFNFNLAVTSGAISDFTEICRVSGWNALSDIYINIPCQTNGSSVISATVTPAGIVKIYCGTGTFTTGFYRTFFCIPCNS